MFGKSLAESAQLHFREFHLNFVKQRRNTCKRPNASQDFSALAKQAYKCTATLLEPQYDDTSEARVGGQGLKSKLRATRTSSRMLLKHLECFSAHHAHSKHLTSSSKQETLSSQAPNMLCPCLFLLTQNKRFKHSSQLMQCKLVVHVTCARHPVNCKGTHKEVKNFHTKAGCVASQVRLFGTEVPENINYAQKRKNSRGVLGLLNTAELCAGNTERKH